MLTVARRVLAVAVLLAAAAVALQSAAHPVSTLMAARWATGRPVERRWVPLESIPRSLVESVILSEDAQFCREHGVDFGALRDVLSDGEPSRGASTLTMQLAKNLFLWPGRSYLRKSLEIPTALLLDALWGKRKVLEAYLNVAEWGPDGEFGIAAGAERAFGVPLSALTGRQAALLATALPNPIERDPARPSRRHRLLARRILDLRGGAPALAACVR